MSVLTERVQVLMATEQLDALRVIARRQHKSVGALMREAAQSVYLTPDPNRRMDALRRLAAMQLPVADWEDMERESIHWIEDER